MANAYTRFWRGAPVRPVHPRSRESDWWRLATLNVELSGHLWNNPENKKRQSYVLVVGTDQFVHLELYGYG